MRPGMGLSHHGLFAMRAGLPRLAQPWGQAGGTRPATARVELTPHKERESCPRLRRSCSTMAKTRGKWGASSRSEAEAPEGRSAGH